MKYKLVFFIIFMLCCKFVFGQTISQMDIEFGKPIKAYSVSEFIWMTPEYAIDGQVCRMRLYPKRISADTNYHSKELPFDDFRNVVEQIVPLNKRGAKKLPFDSLWTIGGGAKWAIFTYEKVRIIYSAGFKIAPSVRKEKNPDLSLPEDTLSLLDEGSESPVKPELVKPENDFLSYRASKAEIVTIIWLDRKCNTK